MFIGAYDSKHLELETVGAQQLHKWEKKVIGYGATYTCGFSISIWLTSVGKAAIIELR